MGPTRRSRTAAPGRPAGHSAAARPCYRDVPAALPQVTCAHLAQPPPPPLPPARDEGTQVPFAEPPPSGEGAPGVPRGGRAAATASFLPGAEPCNRVREPARTSRGPPRGSGFAAVPCHPVPAPAAPCGRARPPPRPAAAQRPPRCCQRPRRRARPLPGRCQGMKRILRRLRGRRLPPPARPGSSHRTCRTAPRGSPPSSPPRGGGGGGETPTATLAFASCCARRGGRGAGAARGASAAGGAALRPSGFRRGAARHGPTLPAAGGGG